MVSLANAIRIGSKSISQCVGEYVKTTFIDGVITATHACALGSAALGIGVETFEEFKIAKALRQRFPELDDHDAQCPICLEYREDLAAIIIHLNDYHTWTREAIAAWIDNVSLDLTPGAATVEVTA